MKCFICFLFMVMLISIDATSQNSDSLALTNITLPFAQVADSFLREFSQLHPDDTTEGGELKETSRLIEFMSTKNCLNAPVGTPRTQAWNSALNKYMKNMGNYCTNATGKFQGNWRCMGPFINNYGGTERSGRVEAVWVDPSDEDHILAGAQSGGLWETNDLGVNWVNITDASSASTIPATMGVLDIAVNPQDHQIIYLSTGNEGVGNREKSWAYTTGVVYSINGGTSWTQDDDINALMGATTNSYGLSQTTTKIAYMPGTTKLFAIWENKVFYRSAQNQTWQNISYSGMNVTGLKLKDIEFSKATTGKVIIPSNELGGIVKYWVYDTNPSTPTWTEYTLSLPSGSFNRDKGVLDMTVSVNDDLLFTAVTTLGVSFGSVLLGGTSVTILNPAISYEKVLASPTNANIVYFTIHDGSNSFGEAPDISQTPPVSVVDISNSAHADGRALAAFVNANGEDVIFGGTDGGVARRNPTTGYFSGIVGNGLCITQFYGFSTPEDDEDIIFGGAQDNGGNSFIRKRTPQWIASDPGGDGYLTGFARNGVKQSMIGMNYPQLYGSTYNSTSLSSFYVDNPADGGNLPNWFGNANQHRAILFDKDNRQQVGYYRIWTKELNESTQASWEPLFDRFPVGHIPYNGGTPPLDSVDWVYCKMSEWIIPEKAGYTDRAYIAYRGEATYTDPSTGNQTHDPYSTTYPWLGKLYKISGLTKSPSNSKTYTTPGDWINISPPTVGWCPITDVVINPNNPDEIFVSLGNVNWGLCIQHQPGRYTQPGLVFFRCRHDLGRYICRPASPASQQTRLP